MWKLIDLSSDMWSRVTFKNEDGLEVSFECDNPLAEKIFKAAIKDKYKTLDIQEIVKDKGFPGYYIDENGEVSDMDWEMITEKYGNDKNFEEELDKQANKAVKKYLKKNIILTENHLPLGSFYDLPYKCCFYHDFPNTFTDQQMYEFRYFRQRCLGYTNTMLDCYTFQWKVFYKNIEWHDIDSCTEDLHKIFKRNLMMHLKYYISKIFHKN